MMEERKKIEIEYYDKEASSSNEEIKEAGSLAGFNPLVLESYKFLRSLANAECRNKKVLDYGCGMGIHIIPLSRVAKEVIGIDLSQKSLNIAQKRISENGVKNAKVILMDAEKLEFTDNYFDVIFDGGTFSSIDLNKALPELRRVLKQDGIIIGIETLGHNPLTNFKRQINKITGRRTGWAADHILKMGDLETIKRYFIKTDIYFFHPVSWLAIPFVNLPGGRFLLKSLEGVDKFLLFVFPFFKKYSFKIVFVFYGKKVI